MFSVSSNNVDTVVKFLLELTVLVRRITYLFGHVLSDKCALGDAGTLNGLTRLSVGFHDGTPCTDPKNH